MIPTIMRSLPSLLVVLLILAGCGSANTDLRSESDAEFYGDQVEANEFLTADVVLNSAADLSGTDVAVQGVIREVCQKAGCWLLLESENDRLLRIHVPRNDDGAYAYTLPKDISGREVLVEGRLFEKELSEAEQAHYSEEGNTQAQEREYRIEARGVVVGGARA